MRVLMLTMLFTSVAHAHPEFNPVVVNRYVKFDLIGPSDLRLVYTMMFGAAPAQLARKVADANGDGRLDDAETRGIGDRHAKDIAAGLKLELDGKPWVPVFDPPAVGLAGDRVGPDPFSVDLTARIRLADAARHVVRFDDASTLSDLGETEIRIVAGPGTKLTSAYRGQEGNGVTDRFLFRGPKFSALEDRSIGFSFEAANEPPKPKPPVAQWIALGAGAIALVIVSLLALRKRG